MVINTVINAVINVHAAVAVDVRLEVVDAVVDRARLAVPKRAVVPKAPSSAMVVVA